MRRYLLLHFALTLGVIAILLRLGYAQTVLNSYGQRDKELGVSTKKSLSPNSKGAAIFVDALGPHLVFASNRTGVFQIWAADPVASAQAFQVTTAGGGNQESNQPAWSKIGRIAYQFGAPGVRGIHLIKPDGTGDVRLTTSGGDEIQPSWSPDGRYIVYVSQPSGATDYDVWIHDTKGTPDDASDDLDYCLSDSQGTCLQGGAGTQEFHPAWSPDGTQIAFVTTAPGKNSHGNNQKIAVVPVVLNNATVQTSGPFVVLTDDQFTNLSPTWSADSKNIAYATSKNGNYNIYRMTATGQKKKQLTKNPANDINPAWSLYGTSIAFVTDRDGNREIYRMNAVNGEKDTRNLIRITNNTSDEDNAPEWEVTDKYGMSGGNAKDCLGGAGTLGSMVLENGKQYVLSNDHVLGEPSSPSSNSANDGDPITEPGLADNEGKPARTIAKFSFDLTPTLDKGVDAALAEVQQSKLTPTGEILRIGIPAKKTGKAKLNMVVAKQGMTTGLTCGQVISPDCDLNDLAYEDCNGNKFFVSFTHQVAIASLNGPFSCGGDSGSLIVDAKNARPVGLLIAGNADQACSPGSSTITIANPIGTVLKEVGKATFAAGSEHAVAGCSEANESERGEFPSESDWQRAVRAKEVYSGRLLQDDAVVAACPGTSEGAPAKAAVIVFVRNDRAHRPIPDEVDGVPTRIWYIAPLTPNRGQGCSSHAARQSSEKKLE